MKPICNRSILTASICLLALAGSEFTAPSVRAQDAGDASNMGAQAPGSGGAQQEQGSPMLQRFRAMRAARMGGTRRQAPPQSSPDVKVQKDVAYGQLPRQSMDIYMPAKLNRPAPILMFAHGGGWEIGDKKQHIDKGFNYAKDGVVFVSIDYRLAPDVVHPKEVQDVAAAFAWLKQHAPELGGDQNKMYVMGHSAGAQLVDLLATNERFLKEQGLTLKEIKGVISLDTASLDLNARLAEGSGEAKLVGPMIRKAFGSDPKVLADGSPLNAIHSGQSYPPFLMFCGARRVDCVAQHKEFSRALKQVGCTVTVQSVPLSHSEINQQAGQPETDIYKQIIAMIR
jgi:arylformamidase